MHVSLPNEYLSRKHDTGGQAFIRMRTSRMNSHGVYQRTCVQMRRTAVKYASLGRRGDEPARKRERER